MKEFLYRIIEYVAIIHDRLLHINDAFETALSDKELHFLVIGVCGIALFLLVHLLFTQIAKFSITAISWIYTMTLLVVITFAIEIGQNLTNTGSMELYDILYGLWGFMAFFTGFLLLRTIFRLILRLLRRGAQTPFEAEAGPDEPEKNRKKRDR